MQARICRPIRAQGGGKRGNKIVYAIGCICTRFLFFAQFIKNKRVFFPAFFYRGDMNFFFAFSFVLAKNYMQFLANLLVGFYQTSFTKWWKKCCEIRFVDDFSARILFSKVYFSRGQTQTAKDVPLNREINQVSFYSVFFCCSCLQKRSLPSRCRY